MRRYCALYGRSRRVAISLASVVHDTHLLYFLVFVGFCRLNTMSKATVYDISQRSRQNKQKLTFPRASRHANFTGMSETQFSALDWKPGKRRRTYVRKLRSGGQKQAPPAFLAMSGSVAGIGSGKHRICGALRRDGEPCRSIAMNGCDTCRLHGGASYTARHVRPYVRKDGVVTVPRCESP